MNCDNCTHDHAGAALAFICIGCPCPERPGKAESDAAVAEAEGDAEWAALNAERADEQADLELDDVLTFLRRHERDQLLGIVAPPLAALIEQLKAGEHRR